LFILYPEKAISYQKNALVVVDELGYQVLDRSETHLFFQFICARYMRTSTIITSNRSVKEWVHIFAADEMATTAILDRLFHKAHIFNIDGESYRLKDFNQKVRYLICPIKEDSEIGHFINEKP